jgi:hypothetical protein
MRVIHKQELRKGCGEQVFRIATLFGILKLGLQDGVPCVWYMCDPDSTSLQDVVFTTIGTGDEMEETWFDDNSYVGSYPLAMDTFIGHVFIRIE